MIENLKPCPFCESSQIFEHEDNHPRKYRVICSDCSACTPFCLTKDDAVKNWNTRPLENALLRRAEIAERAVRILAREIAQHNFSEQAILFDSAMAKAAEEHEKGKE